MTWRGERGLQGTIGAKRTRWSRWGVGRRVRRAGGDSWVSTPEDSVDGRAEGRGREHRRKLGER